MTARVTGAGLHAISATYAGDADHRAGRADVDHLVDPASSGVLLAIDEATPVAGQPVTITATPTASAPGAGNSTGGNISFFDGATRLRTNPIVDGRAVWERARGFSAGSYELRATFTGDTNLRASESALTTVVVAPADTSMTLAHKPASPVYGETVTLTARLSGVAPSLGRPTSGTVTFRRGTTVLGTTAVTGGAARLLVDFLVVGTNDITATYNGSSDYTTTSAGPRSVTVAKAPSSTSLDVYETNASEGKPVTVTAGVEALRPGSGQPGGSVTFLVDGQPYVTRNLRSNGLVSARLELAGGTREVRAVYNGSGRYNTSASPTIVIEVASP